MDIMNTMFIGEKILLILAIITSFIGLIVGFRKSIPHKFDDLDKLGMARISKGLLIIIITYHLMEVPYISQEIRYYLTIPYYIISIIIIALGLSLLIEKRPIQKESNKIET